MIDLSVCPSTLKQGFKTFSPAARKRFLGGKRVSHLLPYDSLSSGQHILENKGHLSLSGAQEKCQPSLTKAYSGLQKIMNRVLI